MHALRQEPADDQRPCERLGDYEEQVDHYSGERRHSYHFLRPLRVLFHYFTDVVETGSEGYRHETDVEQNRHIAE